jgi:hypothetical protein
MLLYHGTSVENALSILKNGFSFEKCGSNWGKTYGHGIYFTPNYDTAKFYAGDKGIVLSIDIAINGYKLNKYLSPNSKKKIKIPEDYNCVISPDEDEYLVKYFIFE